MLGYLKLTLRASCGRQLRLNECGVRGTGPGWNNEGVVPTVCDSTPATGRYVAECYNMEQPFEYSLHPTSLGTRLLWYDIKISASPRAAGSSQLASSSWQASLITNSPSDYPVARADPGACFTLICRWWLHISILVKKPMIPRQFQPVDSDHKIQIHMSF